MEMEMEMEMDRVSALSDDLLISILSCLDVKQAATTSSLSKRWRFVWTDLPSLCFTEETTGVDGQIVAAKRFKADVEGALGSRRGAALEHFSLDFIYEKLMASSVDDWIELAAKNKAQHLNLSLRHRDIGTAKHYTLHHSMYSYSWLKGLRLNHCVMPPPTAAVEWRSMTEISLHSCILPQQDIDHIGSGCPALRRLKLIGCSGGFNRLEIGGRWFRSLHIKYCRHELLQVSAPYMRSLDYVGDPGRGTLRLLTDSVSLQKVRLNLRQSAYDDLNVVTNAYYVFHTIHGANQLVLRNHTLKALSRMASNGWQLPQFKAEFMLIRACEDMHTIPGATLILQSSPFLKSLRIFGLPFGYSDEAIDSDPTIPCNLNCDLLHLKTVIIDVIVDIENSCKSTFILAQTLLKRAPILEKMEIYILKVQMSPSTNLKELIEKFETLFSYPRSSHEARIVISTKQLL